MNRTVLRMCLLLAEDEDVTFSLPTKTSSTLQTLRGQDRPGTCQLPFIRGAPQPTPNLPDRWPWMVVTRQPGITPKLSHCVLPNIQSAASQLYETLSEITLWGKCLKKGRRGSLLRINRNLKSPERENCSLGYNWEILSVMMMNVYSTMARWFGHQDQHSLCHGARLDS